MKPLIVILSAIAISLAFVFWVAIPNISRDIYTAPMIALPIQITRDGRPIDRSEIIGLDYAFTEHRSHDAAANKETKLQPAKELSDDFLLVDAPFTIGPTSQQISPRYRSLTIRLTLEGGAVYRLTIPVTSSTDLNFPIYFDLPKKNEGQ